MNEQQIRALIRQEVAAQTSANRFRLTTNNRHVHNGLDSPKVNAQDLVKNIPVSGNITMAQATTYTLGLANSPSIATSVFFNGVATRGTYTFTVTAANATAGATYTRSGNTYTVRDTIAGGTTLVTNGSALPPSSGTLTKASGTGDASITYSAVTAGIDIRAHCIGTANLGTSFYLQPGTSTTVQAGGTQQNIIQSSSMFLIDSSTSPQTVRALSDEGHILDVEYGGIIARATVLSYSINSIVVSVETLASNWTINGNWVIT